MPASSPMTRQTVGKTFIVASTLLGLVAVVQFGAMAWAFAARYRSLTAGGTEGPREFRTPPAPARPEPPEALAVADPLADSPPSTSAPAPAPAPIAAASTPAPAPAASPAPASSAPIAPPPRPMPVSAAKLAAQAPPAETRFGELIDQGRAAREKGDMATALTRFREAQVIDPSQAQAPGEIALTFEKMGLADKAAEQWRRIYEMGEKAGSFFIAADARLKQSQALALMAAQKQTPPASSGTPVSSTNASASLGIGEVSLQDVADPSVQKKFVLSVPLKARPGVRVDVRDVVIHVLFYDIVDGRSIVQTNANVNSRWASAPPDWAEGDTETLEVEYSQPLSDPRETRREDRKFFGYIVRLYYKSALQDNRAEPLRLAAQFVAPQTLENSQ